MITKTRRIGPGDGGIEFQDTELIDGGRAWHALTDSYLYRWANSAGRCAASTIEGRALVFYGLDDAYDAPLHLLGTEGAARAWRESLREAAETAR